MDESADLPTRNPTPASGPKGLWTQDLGGGLRTADEAAHERITAILESISDGFFALQREWRFTYINREGERLFQKPRDELLGRSFFDIFPHATETVFYEAYSSAMRGEGPIGFEAKSSFLPDTWFEVRAYPSEEGISVYFRDITERREAETAIRENEERYRLMVEGSEQVFFYVHDLEHRFEYLSPSVGGVLGYEPEELLGKPYDMTLAGTESGEVVNELTDQALRTGRKVAPYVGHLLRKDGEVIVAELVETPVIRDGQVVGMQGFARDITERSRAEEALQKSEERYRSLFQESRDAIYITTREGDFLDVNESALELFGYSRTQLLGMNVRQLYVDPLDRVRFQQQIEDSGSVRDFEVQLRSRDGRELDCLISSAVRRDAQGQMVGYQGIIHDITDRKRVQERLLHDALHDALTGLPNRTLFMDRLGFSLERTRRRKEHFAVLFLDLDRFKVVNDSLGHLLGDHLLISLTRRLASCLRPGDTIARLGGDEFTILLSDIASLGDATRVAERIHHALSIPFLLEGQEVFASVSIGIALSAAQYERPEELLRDADIAMYRAKSSGRGQHRVFDSTMHQQAVEILQLETDLRRAVEREEFVLHYQPIVALREGRIVGFEALVRWQHPERGLVWPNDFIPSAEETGLILPLGRWVLEQACVQLRRWQKEFPRTPPLSVSVNLSARQFSQPDLVEQVEAVLEATGVQGSQLHLEITETVVMENAPSAIQMLGRLKARGVQLCIDDFGIGYSSLGYLQRFPIDRLKIDRSFVRGIDEHRDNLEIVQTIVGLARSLGLDAIPEGVENEVHVAHLRALRCRYAQGFYFANPLPPDEAAALLRDDSGRWSGRD